jgi:regulator of protease activity HflC (stomatin/prohibitin superfamily)
MKRGNVSVFFFQIVTKINKEEQKKMSTKGSIGIVTIGICVIVALVLSAMCLHTNNISQMQVIQSFTGSTSIRTQGGIYFKILPKIWTYNKTNQVAFSFEKDESKDNDGVHVFFANKGQGDVSTQITYNLLSEAEKVYKMHELAKGDDDVIDRRILATIREITMREAGQITSSEAIEKREEFANAIRQQLLHNPDYLAIGVDITQFTITNISFDDLTIAAYKKAQEADLQKKTAEAEKLNLVMQKEKVEAEAAKQIAESKGKAEVEKMKAVTDAERQKELAEIKAKQEVAVAELTKQRAIVEANKQLEVAEIQKKEEQARLDVIRIQAEQKVAEAEAKKQQIELAGDIKEKERFELEIQMKTKIEMAKAIAQGLNGVKLPTTLFIGTNGGDGKAGNALDYLINLLTVQKANEVGR